MRACKTCIILIIEYIKIFKAVKNSLRGRNFKPNLNWTVSKDGLTVNIVERRKHVRKFRVHYGNLQYATNYLILGFFKDGESY